MAKRNKLLTQLIQEARERLKEGNYEAQDLKIKVKKHLFIEENKRKNEETRIKRPNITFDIYNLDAKESEITKKIINILSDGNIHMLNEFIDQNEFQKLDEINKQKYILEFSALYNKVCQKVQNC